MKKKYLTISFSAILLIITSNAFAQFSNSRFFIRFTDKNNSPYSVGNPSAYLSARALQRRTNQGISISQQDFPVNPQYLDSVRAHGATTYNTSKWLNGVTISVASQTVLNTIRALPFVSGSIQVKRPVTSGNGNKFESESILSSRSNNPPYQTQSYLYGWSYNQIHIMNGEYLHNLGYHGEGMQIAILDAGFNDASSQPAFDSLRNRGAILGAWDFVDNIANVYTYSNSNAHGAAVLSCIAGNVPDTLVGTAPMADFYLLQSEDNQGENIIEEYNWATAAEYADSAGADIISSSLGYTIFDSLVVNGTPIWNPSNHTYADMDGHTCPSSIAANVAFSKGMLVIIAAGNEGSHTWHYISAPSDADSAMAIGAVDANGNHASFSSWGPSYDGDVKPNVSAQGQGTIVSYNGNIGGGNGTSFATPVLAGSAACLWQAHPNMTNHQIKDAIQRSANYFSAPNDTLGYGIPNFMLAHQILAVQENVKPSEEVIVYPSPFGSGLQLMLNAIPSKEITVDIYNALGAVVSSAKKEINYNSLNIISLPEADKFSKGVYFVKVTADKIYTNRIVKM